MSPDSFAAAYVVGMVSTALLLGYVRVHWPSSPLAELPGVAAIGWPGVLFGALAYYALGWTAWLGEWLARGGRS